MTGQYEEMCPEILFDDAAVSDALKDADKDAALRDSILASLRDIEARSANPERFREHIRWPLILGLLRDGRTHRVTLADGLVFEVSPESRIEQALLLSPQTNPDHVWEPQTTRLLVALGADAANALVGGAYIGDHVLPLARALPAGGIVHAFEPARHAFDRLVRNLELNAIANVCAHGMALWDRPSARLQLSGPPALASASEVAPGDETSEVVIATTIDTYVRRQGLPGLDLIQLDTEGGEERALLGARDVLSRPEGSAPNLVFEVHRQYLDWSDGLPSTSVVRMLSSLGYSVFAIRDVQGNLSMADAPIEVIPAASVYLAGPPHGFNLLAVKDEGIIDRLDIRVVEGVSPKLIPHKDVRLHHPAGGFPRAG